MIFESLSAHRNLTDNEKPVSHYLMGFLNKFNLMHMSQSSFRQKYSFQTALVKLKDHWMKCIDKVDIIETLFVDFRKAFDIVDHGIEEKREG